ncbi:MAG: nickel-dependent hydrogenase large subunit [Gammaproteobacteria bacterium]|nr:nickel-dependent hydrogenase large subunit [Gammaproteobacteria bacterium]
MSGRGERRIAIPALARLSGRCGLDLAIEGDRVAALALCVGETPRLFEKLLEGHDCEQVVDLVARVCGLCPVAHQLAAVQAFERLCGVEPTPWVRAMRRVAALGEWLQNHALHVHLVAAPDYLGGGSVPDVAARHPALLARGLSLQSVGAALVRLLGGRSTHPVALKVGGFHHAPAPAEVAAVSRRVAAAIPEAEALVHWVGALPFPGEQQPFTSVALGHPSEYAVGEGRLQSGDGLDIAAAHFEEHFEPVVVPHSTALHWLLDRRPYLVGPLARLNLNFRELPAGVRAAMNALPVALPSHNTFHGLVARALEMLLALHEARRLLDEYEPPVTPCVAAAPVAGSAVAAVEAPRGLLWHRYEVDRQGHVRQARIVTPTAQNQARCEEDLRVALEEFGLDREDDALREYAERIVRGYDPCLPCAAHCLDLRVARR